MTLINTKLHNIELLLAIRQWKVIGMLQFKCSVCQPECRYFYIPAITSLNAPLGIPISLLVQITRNTPKQRLLFVYVCLYQKSMENNASLLFSGWKPPLPPTPLIRLKADRKIIVLMVTVVFDTSLQYVQLAEMQEVKILYFVLYI